ncbi:Glycoside-Pentoside-Hexuronide family transporter [Phytophthora megakarya]|uniref:Glycoside-Pentoside-Hexuronide family transporter n=1 Tax=Phytophthora megakarya TaxID=4795 RepID=A0A225W270_9STRA|nr:Glycoside-Pentoside-Hexuronide family transporter [Phytophthora megakarya]
MPEAVRQAKRPRRRSSSIVDYRFVTLGLEKDDVSNLDIVPDGEEAEEEAEDDEAGEEEETEATCHTHNHQTTRSVASSYQARKGLSLNQRVEEDVMLPANADVSSKHISNILCERTGK